MTAIRTASSALLIFVITGLWDLLWRLLTEGKIYICLSDDYLITCPNKWDWVKSGEEYFKKHTTLGAMAIAGVSGLIAASIFYIFAHGVFSFDNSTTLVKKLALVFVASALAGMPMRFSPDPISTFLFQNLRDTYYKDLSWWWATFTDAQSGVFVAIPYYLLMGS